LDLIQVGLNNLLCSDLATSAVSQRTPIDETKIEEIVKNAVAAQLANSTAATTNVAKPQFPLPRPHSSRLQWSRKLAALESTLRKIQSDYLKLAPPGIMEFVQIKL
jgi:hypothetical protein